MLLNTFSIHSAEMIRVSKDRPRRTRFCLLLTPDLHPTWSPLCSLAARPPRGAQHSMESFSRWAGLSVGCRVKQVTSWLLLPQNSSAALHSPARAQSCKRNFPEEIRAEAFLYLHKGGWLSPLSSKCLFLKPSAHLLFVHNEMLAVMDAMDKKGLWSHF